MLLFLKCRAKKILQNFARMDEQHHLFMHDSRRDTFSTLSCVDGDWFVYYTINGSYVISYGRHNNKQNIICICIILQCFNAHQIAFIFKTKEKIRTDTLIMINDAYKYAYSINSWNLIIILLIILRLLKYSRKLYEKAFYVLIVYHSHYFFPWHYVYYVIGIM